MTPIRTPWKFRRPGLFALLALVVAGIAASLPAQGQEPPALDLGTLNPSGSRAGANSQEKMSLQATFRISEGRTGMLTIKGKVADGWHCNSIGQVDGPGPLKITLTDESQARLAGEFTSQPAPTAHEYPDIWPGIEVFEHEGEVTWTAPIEITGEQSPAETRIQVKFSAIVCSDACIPFRKTVDAVLESSDGMPAAASVTGGNSPGKAAAGSAAAGTATAGLPPPDQPSHTAGHATVSGELLTPEVAPGGIIRAVLRLKVENGFHVYRYFDVKPELCDYMPTMVRVEPIAAISAASLTPSVAFKTENNGAVETAYFPGDVDLNLELRVSPSAPAGEFNVEGIIAFQSCDSRSCDQPGGARFVIPVRVVADAPATTPADAKATTLQFAKAKYADLAKKPTSWLVPTEGGFPSDTKQADGDKQATPTGQDRTDLSAEATGFNLARLEVQDQGAADSTSLPLILLISLGGGFILNFMPCVLPVIGLKVMSFMQQAGQNRWQALALNLWYTAGILSVFMILATLATFFNFGWGKQSQSPGFQIGLAAVVFVMSLSFLGVWEIPIPGFVGSSSATKAAEKEGILAAFLKGVLTTILAVPCSGPGISVALTWCVGKPPHLVFLVFAFLGLGMAFPYIAIGLFPGLMRMMPRPGVWMETFKEIMGFVLLGTVIWLLWTVPTRMMLPSFAFLFALWFACWWYGQIPLGATTGRKALAWSTCLVIAGAGWLVSFNKLAEAIREKSDREFERRQAELQKSAGVAATAATSAPDAASEQHKLPWEPFSIARLTREVADQKTVVVDFTADWCATCITLERFVLNTEKVHEVVRQNGLVMLMADWSVPNPEIDLMLQKFGSEQIPVLAIFPAGRPNQPIVLMGGYTQKTLLEKLAEAGASRVATASEESARPAEVKVSLKD